VTRLLGELGSSQAGGDGDAVLVVPLGSTEQHGPHLPLGTDTEIAVALAERFAAAHCGALVAPALAYGSSGEHDGFPGTVSIGQEALELVLVELCRSATGTYGRVLLVSAHGGNAAPLERAARLLREERRDVLAFSPDWSGDAHAGRVETSLMLALRPELVELEAAEPGNTAPVAELIGALREGGVRSVSPNGVLGDPTGASAEEGERLLAAATEKLTEAAARWLDREPAVG
jgi:mycofactocin precursor peptide peptidase